MLGLSICCFINIHFLFSCPALSQSSGPSSNYLPLGRPAQPAPLKAAQHPAHDWWPAWFTLGHYLKLPCFIVYSLYLMRGQNAAILFTTILTAQYTFVKEKNECHLSICIWGSLNFLNHAYHDCFLSLITFLHV